MFKNKIKKLPSGITAHNNFILKKTNVLQQKHLKLKMEFLGMCSFI